MGTTNYHTNITIINNKININSFQYFYDDDDDDDEESTDNNFDDYDDIHDNSVDADYPVDDKDLPPLCPGSLRECLTACSPVNNINHVAYKLCVNECLERC